MAAPDVTKVQGATGRLVWNPSNLSSAFPHGGTALGLASEVRLTPIQRSFVATAEEYGGATVEEYDMGRDWVLSCLVRGFDADMLAVVFPSVSTGVVTEALAQSKGAALSARSGVLVLSPRDPTHYGFVLRRALPRVRESARIPFSLHERASFAAIFRAIPSSGGAVLTVGPFSGLTV